LYQRFARRAAGRRRGAGAAGDGGADRARRSGLVAAGSARDEVHPWWRSARRRRGAQFAEGESGDSGRAVRRIAAAGCWRWTARCMRKPASLQAELLWNNTV